jgi:hypothetical protein
LGIIHPDVLLDSLTGNQVAEWEAYDRLEPIGGFRQDYRFAQVCHLIFEIAESLYGRKGQRRKSTPWDFMPWGDHAEGRVRKQSVEELKRALILAFKPVPKRGPDR